MCVRNGARGSEEFVESLSQLNWTQCGKRLRRDMSKVSGRGSLSAQHCLRLLLDMQSDCSSR